MIRDLDLARQLLLDVESRGADCSVSLLHSGPEQDQEERIRYHLRLLLDAGLLKEVDRTSAGVPCVRLTHDGHELLALAGNNSRWQEAQWVCRERLGCLSLSVIRSILTRWALEGSARLDRRRTKYRSEPEYYREAPASRLESQRYADRWTDWDVRNDDVRYVRVCSEDTAYRSSELRSGIDVDGDGRIDFELESPLPTYVL